MNRIKKFFYRNTKRKTLYHKDFEGKTILVKTVNGVNYYRFKDDLDMPYGRYIYLSSFLQSIELRMNLATLNGYIDQLEANLGGSKGKIDVGGSVILLKQLKTRTKILFDEDLAYSLASCIFFTDDEELNTYSMEKNKKKIEAWRSSGSLDFFMLMPVRELLGLKGISVEDLMTYLEQTRPVITELNSLMQKASPNGDLILPGGPLKG